MRVTTDQGDEGDRGDQGDQDDEGGKVALFDISI